MKRALVIVLAAALVAPAGAYAGAVNLRVNADTGPGTKVRQATLTCDSDGPRATGFLRGRDAAELCRRAYALERFLGRGPEPGRQCTQQYGGPERALVRGNVRGTAVKRRFKRTDGCEIADWRRARLLLPRPASG
ncbi:MAG TPA: hypothetical protein VF549_10925 [Solirubrobacteraceae bacterium]